MEDIKIVVIAGATATGKTLFALELGSIFGAEIISADSMQVYRFMDIGTAKPTLKQRKEVPHHLIDIIDPNSNYSAADFKRDGEAAISDITRRDKPVFIVGGSGLYMRSLMQGIFKAPQRDDSLRERLLSAASLQGNVFLHDELKRVDPASAGRIHPNNVHRIIRALEVYYSTGSPISKLQIESCFKERFTTLKIGLVKDRSELYADIEKRVDSMMDEGFLEEVKGLLKMGYSPKLKSMRSLGYKEMCGYIEGRYGLQDAVREIKKNTRNYAKRQITWFKKDDSIRWFPSDEKTAIIRIVKEFLK